MSPTAPPSLRQHGDASLRDRREREALLASAQPHFAGAELEDAVVGTDFWQLGYQLIRGLSRLAVFERRVGVLDGHEMVAVARKAWSAPPTAGVDGLPRRSLYLAVGGSTREVAQLRNQCRSFNMRRALQDPGEVPLRMLGFVARDLGLVEVPGLDPFALEPPRAEG